MRAVRTCQSSGNYLLTFYKSRFGPGTVHLGLNVTGTVFFPQYFVLPVPMAALSTV